MLVEIVVLFQTARADRLVDMQHQYAICAGGSHKGLHARVPGARIRGVAHLHEVILIGKRRGAVYFYRAAGLRVILAVNIEALRLRIGLRRVGHLPTEIISAPRVKIDGARSGCFFLFSAVAAVGHQREHTHSHIIGRGLSAEARRLPHIPRGSDRL